MTLNEMRDFLTYVWYLFLACLLIYFILGITYNFFKQIREERENKKMVNEFIESILNSDENNTKDDKK